MQKTKIEYLNETWNPIAMKCTPVSAGCANCWHLRMRTRFPHDGHPVLKNRELNAPLHLRKPALIGVQYMGDLFHESVPDEFVTEILGVMDKASKHTFCVLTKRPERIKILGTADNIWLGVSVEDQKTADERIPILLHTPAAHRFVSYEPALGRVDFSNFLTTTRWLDWIIMGGESGPSARPMNPEWARSVRDQCKQAGIPFFFKQMSGKKEIPKDLCIQEYPKGVR